MTHLHLKQFEGPFDLLLSLVEDEELNISELALSEVTEQYLAYLDTLGEEKAEEMADFLVVATRLLLLKSKQLLPQFAPEEDEGPGLEEQLKLYKQFVLASKDIHTMWEGPLQGYIRKEAPRKPSEFAPPENVTLGQLEQTMVQLLHRIAPPKALPQATIDRNVSLKNKIDTIRHILKKGKKMSFSALLNDAGNKTEIIVSFLAILELMKQRTLSLRQEGNFSDITIESV